MQNEEEMNYEEKYKEALERAKSKRDEYKRLDGPKSYVPQDIEFIFPELKESEDERIKKELISFITDRKSWFPKEETKASWIAWLEKQGVKDNNEDVDILQRFSFYSYKDEPNVLYLSGLYVNEEYRNKGIGKKILKIADKVSTSMKCNYIRLKTESCSDAERLYKENGYNTLKKVGNQVWLEKKGEK